MSEVGTQYFLGNTEIIQSYIGDTEVLINPYNVKILSGSQLIEWLVVAGGGSSGEDNAGGGGAGGLLSGSFIPQSSLTFTTIVGAGGGISPLGNGKNSIISSSLFISESIGGGVGRGNQFNGANGGSGGGGGGANFPTSGGTGTIGQGKNGGSGQPSIGGGSGAAGGGGGASQVGGNGVVISFPPPAQNFGGNGGSGSQWLDGNFYAGGGGAYVQSGTRGIGGPGGGGDGAPSDGSTTGSFGSPNTGGGGGGSFTGNGGGSGIVIFRYLDSAYQSGTITGGDSIITSGSYVYHKFLNVATSSLVISL